MPRKLSNKELDEKFEHLLSKGWSFRRIKSTSKKPLFLKTLRRHFHGCVGSHL